MKKILHIGLFISMAVGGTSCFAANNEPIKSCDDFVQRWLDNFEYASRYFSYKCLLNKLTTPEDATLVIHGKPGSANNDYWYFYPKQNQVLRVKPNNTREWLSASTFKPINEDVSANKNEINLKNLSPKEKEKICKSINAASNDIVQSIPLGIAVGSDAATVARNGNWSWRGTSYMDNSCYVTVLIAGILNGNSINKSVTCGVRTVEKSGSGRDGYRIKWLAIGGGFDEGCK